MLALGTCPRGVGHSLFPNLLFLFFVFSLSFFLFLVFSFFVFSFFFFLFRVFFFFVFTFLFFCFVLFSFSFLCWLDLAVSGFFPGRDFGWILGAAIRHQSARIPAWQFACVFCFSSRSHHTAGGCRSPYSSNSGLDFSLKTQKSPFLLAFLFPAFAGECRPGPALARARPAPYATFRLPCCGCARERRAHFFAGARESPRGRARLGCG